MPSGYTTGPFNQVVDDFHVTGGSIDVPQKHVDMIANIYLHPKLKDDDRTKRIVLEALFAFMSMRIV